MPLRGGEWLIGVGAGVFALSLRTRHSYYYDYIGFRAALFFRPIKFGDKQKLPLRGGSWKQSFDAGVFALDFAYSCSQSLSNLGFRAAYLFSQIYPAYGLGFGTMRKKGLSPAF